MPHKRQLFAEIDNHADTFRDVSRSIGSRPELGHEEFFASDLLCGKLAQFGFEVERGVLGIPTSFLAVYDTGKPGPTAAFLCEYDALPELGHACGHHLIASMGIAAAVGLKAALDAGGIGGKIRVYGTPAEETRGAKVPMAEAGLFDDCDFALMAHPYYAFERSGESLALDALRFEYAGAASHAAASPHEGVNALDAVISLFNGINALRQQTRSDARIHGIIDNGGQAPNIIPDYASAKFYVRSATRTYTDELTAKVLRCAEGAALQTGCTLTVSRYEYSYDELMTNETLSGQFNANLIQAGIAPERIETGKDHGSLDLGNVSVRCPAIHPYVQVVQEKLLLHTEGFRDAAMTDYALDGMLFGAKMLAATAYDVYADPALLARIREEFESSKP
ncbi:M20 family metallopeptidase [Paenibacillus arenilitoris]|uniref:Peptidase M20 domain-containing protein 2 n=1 Tax=Paenibacillus arenilitoris TaxID=2772299 RepID=A0A927CSS3_9BACL|nr:M20 family metallopeptidase [Paenibacillus arenilitoris]MBD2871566.1 M20 family metallopeptidase [Paenibacillus arenilitoris]